jgi:glucose-1-phosphatase
MIRTIVFDLGNVLLRYQPGPYLRTVLSEPAWIPALLDEVFDSAEWLLLDRGLIGEPEAIARWIARKPCPERTIREALAGWTDMLVPIEGTVDLLRRLKRQGYRLLYLSNFHTRAWDAVTARCDFFALFDGGVVSFRDGLMKPDAEIFQRLVATSGILPEETVFTDDLETNILAAARLGFATIPFVGPEDLEDRLRALGVAL